MTRARASQIYRRDFWDKVRGDDLPVGLDLVAFDTAVNSGVGRAARGLQEAVGATVDGRIGPETVAFARSAHAEAAIDRACDARLRFLRQTGTWPRYGKTWTRRVESVRDVAASMARKTVTTPKPPLLTLPDQPRPSSPAAETTRGLAWALPVILSAAVAAVAILGG